MKIFFTKHAEDKLREKESRKFKINKTKLEDTLGKPRFKKSLRGGVIRLTGNLDKDHSLCIIYKVERGRAKVITFFPTEKGRYAT